MPLALDELATALDTRLREFVDRQPVRQFYDLTHHQIGWPEPQCHVHGLLCVAACEAAGGDPETAMPLAMAVALLRHFQLVQEDLELERAERDGRPTVWAKWSRAQAMNAGDGLHALAKMALLEASGLVPAATILDLEEELDQCCLAVCEAKQRELAGEAGQSSQAVLFGCAAAAGARIAGASSELIETMRKFGANLAPLLAR